MFSPLYEKFAKLSWQEADWGLLDDLGKIRDRRGWQKCLEEHCAELQGYRVIWSKNGDPYTIKLQRSLIRSKQAHQKSGNSLG